MGKEFVCRQEGLSSDLQYPHDKSQASVTTCLEFQHSGCRHQRSQGQAGWLDKSDWQTPGPARATVPVMKSEEQLKITDINL